jgi:hypothetical protein
MQKSALGRKRTVSLKNLGLVVRMAVSSAMVSPTSVGNWQMHALNVEIEVDNSNP